MSSVTYNLGSKEFGEIPMVTLDSQTPKLSNIEYLSIFVVPTKTEALSLSRKYNLKATPVFVESRFQKGWTLQSKDGSFYPDLVEGMLFARSLNLNIVSTVDQRMWPYNQEEKRYA